MDCEIEAHRCITWLRSSCSHELSRSGAGILPPPSPLPMPILAALLSAAAFSLLCLRFPPSHANCMMNTIGVTLCRLASKPVV
jgi:hypothetical protein